MVKDFDLLAAHMVGDYILQTNKEAIFKTKDLKILHDHCIKYTASFVPFLLLGRDKNKLAFLCLVYLTHFLTDSRRWASGEDWPPKPILVDQAIHAVTLAVLRRLL